MPESGSVSGGRSTTRSTPQLVGSKDSGGVCRSVFWPRPKHRTQTGIDSPQPTPLGQGIVTVARRSALAGCQRGTGLTDGVTTVGMVNHSFTGPVAGVRRALAVNVWGNFGGNPKKKKFIKPLKSINYILFSVVSLSAKVHNIPKRGVSAYIPVYPVHPCKFPTHYLSSSPMARLRAP